MASTIWLDRNFEREIPIAVEEHACRESYK